MLSLFESWLTGNASNAVTSSCLETSASEIRGSCGRVAKIGDIYDARSDQFVEGYNIFTENVDSFIKPQSAEKYNSEFMYTSMVSQKLDKLDIHGELTISMLTNLLKSSGSAKFVHEKVKDEETVQYSYIVNVRTVKESINMNDKGLKKLITDNFNDCGTHVVVGITYGANAVAAINFENYKNQDKRIISMQLKSLIAKFQNGGVEGGSGIEYDTGDDEILNKVGYKIHADLLPHGQETPGNIQDAIGRMNALEREMVAPGFKGKIMEYYLMSLSRVKQIFKISNMEVPVYRPIDSSVIKRLEQFFDSIHEASAKLQSLVNLKNEDVVSAREKNDIENYARNVEIGEAQMLQELSEIVKKVRCGESSATKIKEYIYEFERESSASPVKIDDFVQSHKPLKDKILFVKKRLTDNVIIVTEENRLTHVKIDEGYKFMLFFSYSIDRKSPDFFANFKIFDKYKEKQKQSKFAYIDTDILDGITKDEELETFCIALFKTKYVLKNCLKEQLPLSIRLSHFPR